MTTGTTMATPLYRDNQTPVIGVGNVQDAIDILKGPAFSLAANVTSAGALSAGRGIASASKTATGVYSLVLSTGIALAASYATVVTSRGTAAIITAVEIVDATHINVRTFNTTGAATDAAFSLMAFKLLG